MSITIELPPDIEDRVRSIPDLNQRIAEFLRHQSSLEEWRGRRYGPEARALVAQAAAEVAELLAKNDSREQALRDLREAREEIGKHL